MSQADEILHIETPENVAFGYEIAGIGSRFLAALVDTLIIALIQVVVYTVLILIVSILLGSASEDIGGPWLLALGVLVSFVMLWGYYLFFELVWNGQTPGKRLVKLRVIRADGMPVTLSEVLIRNLVRLVDFMPVSYGVGVISMFVSKQSQRLYHREPHPDPAGPGEPRHQRARRDARRRDPRLPGPPRGRTARGRGRG